ncbi:hypothetical protein MP638_004406 [Amoeboaphelidium occidentale]|nr:hypothetical protein MP638_004406 [Amoeboaphelidium occidentale]
MDQQPLSPQRCAAELKAVDKEIKELNNKILEVSSKDTLTEGDNRRLTELRSQLAKFEKKEEYWQTELRNAQQSTLSRTTDRRESVPQSLVNEFAALKFEVPSPAFFSDVGGYVDSSRLAAINTLERRVERLVANTLRGQMQCFLVIGMHGVGKSQFLIELGRWSAHIATPTHAFVYLPCDNKVAKSTLVKTLYDVAKHLGWITDEPMWGSISLCWKWLIKSGRTMLVVLDEFENIYRTADQDWTSQLRLVGDMSGPRPLMVLLCGSAARLRDLCFKFMDHTDCVSLGFPGYKESCSLNSTKFVPLTLASISSILDMKRALDVLKISTEDESAIWSLCCRTRGRIRQISTECETDCSNVLDVSAGHLNWKTAFLNLSGDERTLMEQMWKHAKTQLPIGEQADIVSLSGKWDNWSRLMNVSSVQGISNVGNLLYKMADSSLISYHGSYIFGFAHPIDLWICSILFEGYGISNVLSWAEKLSLRLPFNAGTDDVNERLVVQSFCENGLECPKFPKLRFVDSFHEPCFTGYVEETERLRFDASGLTASDPIHPLNSTYLGQIRKGKCITAAHFRKEYPDMAGGDAIAVYKNDQLGSEYDYFVIRVQIMLGLSNSNVDNPIDKMVLHAGDLATLIGIDASRIQTIYVLWTSRPHRVPSVPNFIVIDSKAMLKHWAKKVKSYVKSEKLVPYGYNG